MILEVNKQQKCSYTIIRKEPRFPPFFPFKPPENPLKGDSETQIEQFWYWLYLNFYFHVFLSHSNGFEIFWFFTLWPP